MKRKEKGQSLQINRILVATGIIVTIAVIIFVSTTIRNTDNLADYITNIYNNSYTATINIMKLRTEMQFSQSLITEVVTNPRAFSEEEARKEIGATHENGDLIAEGIKHENENNNIDLILRQYAHLNAAQDYLLELVYMGREAEALQYFEGTETPLFSNVDAMLGRLVDTASGNMETYVQEATQLNIRTNRVALSLGLVAVLLTMFACILSAAIISRKNEQAYHNETLFKILTQNVDDVFILFDMKQRKVEYISPNMERMNGMTPQEYMTGDNWRFGNTTAKDIFQVMENLYHSGKEGLPAMEYEITDVRTGEVKLVRSEVYPLLDRQGRLSKLICMTHDITKDKNEQEMLQNALKAANAANVAKRDFLSRMSHEVKTPINAIVGMRDMAEQAIGDDTKVLDCLKKIESAATHLLGVVGDVLDMSRIESGKLKLEYVPFRLDEWAKGLHTLIQYSLDEKRMRFEMDTEKIWCEDVYGDAMHLRQIVVNYLTNAIKFSPERGEIGLIITQGDENADGIWTEFKVRDSGPGIREAFKDMLFEPFEQDKMMENRGGTGLGLSICKALAESMGGSVHAESEEGRGSTFSVALRLKRMGRVAESPRMKIQETFNFSGRRALVAEDNEINMEIMEAMLTSVGFWVDKASDGAQAVAMYEAVPPGYYDLAVMDIQMPVMDGKTAAKRIRGSGRTDAERIVLVAMTANEVRMDTSVESGDPMDVRLGKPVDAKTLFKAVKALFEIRAGKE